MDGKDATVLVRDYFVAANGELGVNLFKVREVSFLEDEQGWLVRCSFFPTPHLTSEYLYEVVVKEPGGITRVKELSRAS